MRTRKSDDHFVRAIAPLPADTKAAQKAAQQTAGMLRTGPHGELSDSAGDPVEQEKTPESPGVASDCDALPSGDNYLPERLGGRYWTRTSDLHDVNVAL
jgi:hypothetical protein